MIVLKKTGKWFLTVVGTIVSLGTLSVVMLLHSFPR